MADPVGKPTVSDAIAALFDTASSDAASSLKVLPNAARLYAEEQARLKAEEELYNTLNGNDPSSLIGQIIGDKGVYFGRYEPVGSNGNSLGKIFNLFAAPQDLPETLQYADAVKYITTLKNWHGHDGTNYAIDKDFHEALEDGRYDGGWIMPPRELLDGTKANGLEDGVRKKIVQPDNLVDHRNTGLFKNTFIARAGEARLKWYWSSSELETHHFVWFTDFLNGNGGYLEKDDNGPLGCRPVRLEPVQNKELS